MHPAGPHAPNAPMARPFDSFNRLVSDRGQSLGLQGMHSTQSTGSRAAQTGSPTTRPSGPTILDRSGTPIPTYPVGPLSIRSGSSQSMRRSVTPSTHMRNVQRARREQEQENIDPRLLAQSGPWANPHANNQNFRNGPGNRNMLTPSSGNAGNHGGMSYGNNNHQPVFGSGYGGTPTHGFGHGDNTAFNSYGNYGGPAPNPGLQYNGFNGGNPMAQSYQGNGFGGQYGGMGPGGPQQPGFMNGDFATNYDGTPNLQSYDSPMQFNAPNMGASGPEHGYGDFGLPPSVPEPQQQQAAQDESPMQAFIEGPVPPLFDEYLERNNVQLQQLQQGPSADNTAAATTPAAPAVPENQTTASDANVGIPPPAPVNEPAPALAPAPAPAPAGPATAPAGPATTPAGPAITPAGPATGPATAPPGPATAPAGPATAPAGPATTPAGPAPTPAGPAPAPTPVAAPAPAGPGFQLPPNLSSDQLYEWYTASGFAGQQQQPQPAATDAQGQGQKRKADDDDDAREDDAKKQKRDDGAGGDGPGTGV
ncbi:uncharacterized protein F4807DRAFT_418825 [Annulohypoxylon truncatum]|uniref:uncharacterized protein n=1 Tax=Annulohypoxylon truncatum TaxID=327061 RepID=UPI0020072627|nr:uncharacterized protein F4807DRAFT_418825 [Annulohypoxylon truncatum]KAI1211733.1 hypothetical protein F4807DRAFT_418825 [Annulohypoxylon truncatum]